MSTKTQIEPNWVFGIFVKLLKLCKVVGQAN